MNSTYHFYQKGQAALIVILITAILMTIGVGAVGRTVVDIQSAKQGEESAQALAAADSALEIALLTLKNDPAFWNNNTCDNIDDIITVLNGTPVTGVNPQDCLVDIGSESSGYWWFEIITNSYLFNTDPWDIGPVENGEVYTIWLKYIYNSTTLGSSYEDDFTLSWEPTDVKLEFILFSHTGTDFAVSKKYIESGGTVTYAHNSEGDIDGDGAVDWMFLRIKPISGNINNLKMSNFTESNFPNQGHTFEAGGFLNSGVQRVYKANKLYDQFPPIFDYVLYAENSIE